MTNSRFFGRIFTRVAREMKQTLEELEMMRKSGRELRFFKEKKDILTLAAAQVESVRKKRGSK